MPPSIMKRLALAIALVVASAVAQAASPSFDCVKAESRAEKLICEYEQLAQLDLETARLFKLARDGKHMSPDRLKQLKAYQRGWIKGRDECWKAENLRTCVRDSYAIRIFELRQGYADTRTADDTGISDGPLVLDCGDFGAGIGVGFVRTDPQLVTLGWEDRKVVLERAPSRSGAEYSGKAFDGPYTLWIKGNEATFDTPEKKGYACRAEVPG